MPMHHAELTAAYLLLLLTSGCRSDLFGTKKDTPVHQQNTPQLQLQGAATSTCKLKTASQWQGFLERNSADNRWTDTCEDSACNASFQRYIQTSVQKTLNDCADVIAANPVIERCSDHTRRFIPTWLRQHDDVSYGFNRNNHSYLTSQDGPSKPEGLVAPPQAIIDALPTREKVEEAARINGWKFLTHDSAIDNIRTFIYVPDPKGRFDQWMILNLRAPGEDQSNLVFSVLGVQKANRDGTPLAKVKLHFRDYNVTQNADRYGLEYTEDRNGKCYACHVSGTRKLIDRETTVTAAKPVKGEADFDPTGTQAAPAGFGVKRLGELNEILMSYGLPDWGEDVTTADHGPVLGAAQGCTSCHNGTNRGALTILTSESQVQKKMSDQLAMPQEDGLIKLLEKADLHNASLTEDERTKLQTAQDGHDKLLGDYMDARLPELQKWLLIEPCQ